MSELIVGNSNRIDSYSDLVHDDVVDKVTKEEVFSVNALWKNKIAVLVGDYLLSKGLLLSIENEDFDIKNYISSC